MICNTIGYCLYWDVGAGETGRETHMVTANTLAVLACALPRWRPLLVFLVVVRLVRRLLEASRSTLCRTQQRIARGIIE